MTFRILHGDCRELLAAMPENSVDSIVTDPPYHLTESKKGGRGLASVNLGTPHGRARVTTGFMGMTWDGGDVAFRAETWAAALRVLKPGGYLLAFGGTRTYHRLVTAIEDAGFEIRDMIAWVYGSGFPKSLDVSKALDDHAFGQWLKAHPEHAERLRAAPDKAAREAVEAELRELSGTARKVVGYDPSKARPNKQNFAKRTDRQPSAGAIEGWQDNGATVTAPATEAAQEWEGWGTALKPALEPIVVARKPLPGTVAENVLTWGVGGLNIDASRVPVTDAAAYARNHSGDRGHAGTRDEDEEGATNLHAGGGSASELGRWPANLIHDGSDEVVSLFPVKAGAASPVKGTEASPASEGVITGERDRVPGAFHADEGSAARFFKSCPMDDESAEVARFLYCPKASRSDRNEGLPSGDEPAVEFGATMSERERADWKARNGNHHPTVKPTALMRYLCRLVTPPGGTVLDMFTGSGSTGKAAVLEGFDFIGTEVTAEYVPIAEARCSNALAKRQEPEPELALEEQPGPMAHPMVRPMVGVMGAPMVAPMVKPWPQPPGTPPVDPPVAPTVKPARVRNVARKAPAANAAQLDFFTERLA